MLYYNGKLRTINSEMNIEGYSTVLIFVFIKELNQYIVIFHIIRDDIN